MNEEHLNQEIAEDRVKQIQKMDAIMPPRLQVDDQNTRLLLLSAGAGGSY